VLPEENNEKPPCASNGSTIHGFSIRGFTLRGFDKHGLHLACVNGFLIDENVAENNGVYGIFPVLSRDGVLTNNTVRGTVRDASVYVGQSDFVLIAGNMTRSRAADDFAVIRARSEELRRERVRPPAEPEAWPLPPRPYHTASAAKPNTDPRRLPQPIWQKLSRPKTPLPKETASK